MEDVFRKMIEGVKAAADAWLAADAQKRADKEEFDRDLATLSPEAAFIKRGLMFSHAVSLKRTGPGPLNDRSKAERLDDLAELSDEKGLEKYGQVFVDTRRLIASGELELPDGAPQSHEIGERRTEPTPGRSDKSSRDSEACPPSSPSASPQSNHGAQAEHHPEFPSQSSSLSQDTGAHAGPSRAGEIPPENPIQGETGDAWKRLSAIQWLLREIGDDQSRPCRVDLDAPGLYLPPGRDWLRKLRTASGRTQADVAAALSVTKQAVSNWETGADGPDRDKTFLLADLLGVGVLTHFANEARERQDGIAE